MPFEPEVNRFDVIPPKGSFPDVRECDGSQIFELCKVWDARGLLRLIPTSLGPRQDELFLHSKVFGNYKSPEADRQIGDRRGRNFVEGRLLNGPSHNIPNATALLQLEVRRYEEVLVVAIADRRDFYRQRAASNTIYPAFALGDFFGLKAYDQFLTDFGQKKKQSRETAGAFLGMPKPPSWS